MAGHRRTLGREVAVKLLHADVARDKVFAALPREARHLARISHPAIVAVYDFGEDDGTHYLVMEYVAGRTLAQLLRDEGAQSAGFVGDFPDSAPTRSRWRMRRGSSTATSNRATSLVTADGHPKLTDFGIARMLTGSGLTRTGEVLGTPVPQPRAGRRGRQTPAVTSMRWRSWASRCSRGQEPSTGRPRSETAWRSSTTRRRTCLRTHRGPGVVIGSCLARTQDVGPRRPACCPASWPRCASNPRRAEPDAARRRRPTPLPTPQPQVLHAQSSRPQLPAADVGLPHVAERRARDHGRSLRRPSHAPVACPGTWSPRWSSSLLVMIALGADPGREGWPRTSQRADSSPRGGRNTHPPGVDTHKWRPGTTPPCRGP